MRILVLDDLKARVSWLREVVEPRVVIDWVGTVEGFEALYPNGYDLVILDHDLGVDDPSYTGVAAAMMIQYDQHVLIWSANPVGAQNIARVVRARGGLPILCPFEVDRLPELVNLLEILIGGTDAAF